MLGKRTRILWCRRPVGGFAWWHENITRRRDASATKSRICESSQILLQRGLVEFIFPARHHQGCHAVSDHVDHGACHAHEMRSDADQQRHARHRDGGYHHQCIATRAMPGMPLRSRRSLLWKSVQLPRKSSTAAGPSSGECFVACATNSAAMVMYMLLPSVLNV